MKVFVAGTNGLITDYVLKELVKAGNRVIALEGHTKDPLIKYVHVDLHDINRLKQLMKGCHAVINLIDLIKEGRTVSYKKANIDYVMSLIVAAKKAKVKKFIQLSAIGSRSKKTKYLSSKLEAEELVIYSGLSYTIIRPAMMYGHNDEFITPLIKKIKKHKTVYVYSNGDFKIQLVHMSDVARAVVFGLKAHGIFEIGAEVVTYNELVNMICNFTYKRPKIIHLPAFFAKKEYAEFTNHDYFEMHNTKHMKLETELKRISRSF